MTEMARSTEEDWCDIDPSVVYGTWQKQVFRVKKLVGLPPQLKLLALALNCWLG